ncbi:carbohydrate ABC transporter permease [Paenibacillus sp. FSL H7-0331]|uniref:carbohydrate ABC transporter permease n=1 Tax=Paenibacillus sp. FSL H7-0331 TaxID=1920421 RepID=UPI00096C967A|nr:carbohydrate ABC transporter permease [Paenibacillus sp. FSL H7-0331]OMF08773.1 sugar ABC transporter permease [Paenibacillus sp. FSL H7-0331]
MKLTRGEKWFSGFNYVLLSLTAVAALYPFLYVLSASISSPEQVVKGNVLLFPKDVTFTAYRTVLAENGIWLGYANTIFYTLVGTMVSLMLTILGAYSLSKKRLIGVTVINFIIAFTMWINMSGAAGMIPYYLNLRDLGLLNSRFGIIIAFAITTFNVFLLRTFFTSVPDSLEEAARVDGANDWGIMCRIYIPLSVPALITVGLFYAVGRWNAYFWSMILLTDQSKIPLQVLLKKMIVEMNVNSMLDNGGPVDIAKETIIYATIIVAILPMVLVYPYIQKFFVQGIMVGSIKE